MKRKFVVLTDIEGIEDNYGDMDFKIAGTRDGITAIQMDTKLKGMPFIFPEIFEKARVTRCKSWIKWRRPLPAPRPEVSHYAPRMYKMKIDVEKIGAVIGTGGKTIRAIIEQTKATIDIEDDGTVIIGSSDEASAKRAIEIVEGLTKEIEVGTIYTGKVTRILPFGAIVEILPGKEGMIHISELSDHRVNLIEDEVKVGDEVTAKVIRTKTAKLPFPARRSSKPRPDRQRRTDPRHFDRPPRRDFPPRPPRNPNQ